MQTDANRLGRAACMLGLGACLLIGQGCMDAKPTGTVRGGGATGAEWSGVEAGVFVPERLRVHGLTRLIGATNNEGARIDLHFELVDRFGHGVKALGEVRVELYEGSMSGDRLREGATQRRLWRLDLRDPDANAEAYDRVTRTYWLILRDLPEEVIRNPSGGLQLQVRFTLPGGHEVSAVHRLS